LIRLPFRIKLALHDNHTFLVFLSHAMQHVSYGRAKQNKEFTKELLPVHNLSIFFNAEFHQNVKNTNRMGIFLLQYSLLWEKNHQILKKKIWV
jgi:hypothetical protein